MTMIDAAFYRGDRRFKVEPAEVPDLKPHEVQLRIAYCGICGTDMHVFHGNMDARVGHNRILGHEMSAVVEKTGAEVTDISVGQKVVVRPLDPCNDCPACHAGNSHICHNQKFRGLDTDGAMRELWNVPAYVLHLLPDNMRLDHAALIEPVAVACHDVRLAAIKQGEDVLVIGGGPIGALVAMVARDAGGKVIVSEVNPKRLQILEALGFETINPKETDLKEQINQRTSGKGADVVFEVSGTQAGVDAMTAVAAVRARIVMVAIHANKPQVDLFQFFWRELNLIGARVYQSEDYEKAIKLVSTGKIAADTVITDIQPLHDIQTAFETLDNDPVALKSLIKIGEFA